MFFHVINTWAIANLLHPVTMFLFSLIETDENFNMENIGFFFMFMFISFLISIPSLIIARIFIYPILKLKLEWHEKFILWIIGIIISIIINFWGLALLFDGDINIYGLYLLIPSAAAALLSVLVRIRSFISLESEYKNIN